MNTREKIISLVKDNEYPTLHNLIQIDDHNYSTILYLIKLFTGFTLKLNNIQNNEIREFADSSGNVLFKIIKKPEGDWEGVGEIATKIDAQLVAIRIHEVDSFEWVYLPPAMRQNLIEERAQNVGITPQELKRYMSIWLE